MSKDFFYYLCLGKQTGKHVFFDSSLLKTRYAKKGVGGGE